MHSISQIKLSNMTLNHVLYIPSFKCNLLSISRLTKALQCSVMFFPSFCVLQGLKSKKLIGMGELHNGLYYFHGFYLLFATTASFPSSSILWHERLDHLSFDRLSLIPELSSVSFKNSNNYCDVCHCAKQTRNVFPLSNNKSNFPF
jgi:hypothetical protein